MNKFLLFSLVIILASSCSKPNLDGHWHKSDANSQFRLEDIIVDSVVVDGVGAPSPLFTSVSIWIPSYDGDTLWRYKYEVSVCI